MSARTRATSDERDEFALAEPAPASGWRAFVRGDRRRARRAPGSRSSARAWRSAAASRPARACPPRRRSRSRCASRSSSSARAHAPSEAEPVDRTEIAQLCARVENEWVGAHTGLLDQLALALRRARHRAVHRLPHARRSSRCRCGWATGGSSCSTPASVTCTRAPATTSDARSARAPASCWASSRCARSTRPRRSSTARAAASARRARARRERAGASRPSLRCARATCRRSERCWTPPTRACATATRSPRPPSRRPSQRLREAGASGARMVGGGFGGSVLGLFAPGVRHSRRCARGAPRRGRAPAGRLTRGGRGRV